jgi:hypothetical protein
MGYRIALAPQAGQYNVNPDKSKYSGPGSALIKPLQPFRAETLDKILYRRYLTEIAMLGVGEKVGIIRESVVNVNETLDADGILRTFFDMPKYRCYLANIEYPTAYVDVILEPDYKRKYAQECGLTFWAIQFLTLAEERNQPLFIER